MPFERAMQLREQFHSHAPLIVDGGLATELEKRGCDISGPLWSAKVLLEQPKAIEQLHFDYLEAGADVIITSSYQLSEAGLARADGDRGEFAALLAKTTELAASARARLAKKPGKGRRGKQLIAASIGPYGAHLADGSEYHGNYGVSHKELASFHARRIELLAKDSRADLLACETMPSLQEAEVLAELLSRQTKPAWVTFTCKDEAHMAHGELIEAGAKLLHGVKNICAVGVNCTAPEHIEGLTRRIAEATDKPIVVYPNSGEVWNAQKRCWTGKGHAHDFAELAKKWRKAGASLIGGCCRTGPEHIAAIKAALA